jgi:HEAT repeat protein
VSNAPEPPASGPQEPDAGVRNVQESETDVQPSKLATIEKAVNGGDVDALRNSLQDADPAVQAAAFNALADQGKDAVEELLANIKDTTQPTRLQSLQLLVQSQASDEQATMGVLRNALTDPDPAFNAYAIQALAGRGTPDAIDALRAVLQNADPSVKLMVIESVAQIQDGAPLLHEALSDTDEAVRSAAKIALNNQIDAAAGPTGKP